MDKLRVILIAWILAALCAVSVRAADIQQEQAALFGADELYDALPSKARELMDDLSPMESSGFSAQMKTLLRELLSQSASSLRRAGKSAAGFLCALLICSIASNLESGLSSQAILFSGTVAIFLLFSTDLGSMLALASKTLDEVESFSKLLLPVMTSAAVASGCAAGAGALYVGSSLFVSVLTSVMRTLLLPLVYAAAALAAAQSVMPEQKLGGIQKTLNQGISVCLKALMSIFTAYLTITRILSSSADELTLKAAKAAISGALPVVGSIVSEASGSFLAGAKQLRISIGAFGMAAVLAIGMVPFIRIAVSCIVLKLTAAVGEIFALKEHAKLLSDLSSCLGLMLAITGCAMLMALISVFCFMKVAGG